MRHLIIIIELGLLPLPWIGFMPFWKSFWIVEIKPPDNNLTNAHDNEYSLLSASEDSSHFQWVTTIAEVLQIFSSANFMFKSEHGKLQN